MLATFVIGLREGLEAALIVGIIAAFLRRGGRRLTAMWVGVALAGALSLAVGVTLGAVERALPQAGQEAMESIIGAVAVVFVTGMTLWMNTHSRGMKAGLEGEAERALGRGGARALAVIAFLAVLKEGFETSVFLLATFSAAQSPALAVIGASAGVLAACAIGWGIYAGGVRLNLARFFRITGAFLVLVAAGLVVTTLRTAHEAGWINGGRQPTFDLTWLVHPGTVQSALVTGVLGIPADPRVIEVIGWLAYLVPVSLYLYWPRAHRLSSAGGRRLKLGVAGALGVAALALALILPVPHAPAHQRILLTASDGSGTIGSATLSRGAGAPSTLRIAVRGRSARTVRLEAGDGRASTQDGAGTVTWTIRDRDAPVTTTRTLPQLAALTGGRLPLGLNPQQHPGPFTVTEKDGRTLTVRLLDGVLVDASARSTAVASVSGSGLASPRIVTPSDAATHDWSVDDASLRTARDTAAALTAARDERMLWGLQLPIALAVGAAALAVSALRRRTRPVPVRKPTRTSTPTPTRTGPPVQTPRPADRPGPSRPRSTTDATF